MFMFASAADCNNRSKYVADIRSGNMSAGIQLEPFMNTGLPLILKKKDLPATEITAHNLNL